MATAAPAAAQSARDFQLPPGPTPSASPSSEAAGPIDLEGPRQSAPRVIGPSPTPRPTPTATPAPTASRQPAPTTRNAPVTRTAPTIDPAPPTTRTAAPPQPRNSVSPPDPTIDPASPQPAPIPADVVPDPVESAPAPTFSVPPSPQSTSPAPEAPAKEEGSGLLWWLLSLAGLAALAGTALWTARRRSTPVPTIERPVVRTPAVPDAAMSARSPITVRAQAKRLTRSFMAISVDGEVTVLNRSDRPLRDVAIKAQLSTANGAEQDWTALDTIDRLGPGQSRRVPLSLRLPISAAGVLRQSGVPMVIPLLTLEVEGVDVAPVRSGYAIGPSVPGDVSVKGAAGRVQPIRLDEPPRSYDPVVLRPFEQTAIDEPATAG